MCQMTTNFKINILNYVNRNIYVIEWPKKLIFEIVFILHKSRMSQFKLRFLIYFWKLNLWKYLNLKKIIVITFQLLLYFNMQHLYLFSALSVFLFTLTLSPFYIDFTDVLLKLIATIINWINFKMYTNIFYPFNSKKKFAN